MRKNKKIKYKNTINKRINILIIIVILLFIIVLTKLFNIMIVNQKKYNDKLKELTTNIVTLNSAPRGRIFDRNYNIIVDNKAIKNIVYKNNNDLSKKEIIKLCYKVIKHLDINYNKVSIRNQKEFFIDKYNDVSNSKITSKEIKLLKERKITNKDIYELKIQRITLDDLKIFNEDDIKAAYLYYLMNKGYMYEEKIIKNNANDKEIAYFSEHNYEIPCFYIRTDWERVYPYDNTLKSILGTVSSPSQGIPYELKDYYLKKGYSLNDRVGLSYLEKQYEDVLKGEKALYKVVKSDELKLIKEEKRGNDIVLTIDINLQKELENIITEEIINAKKEPNTEYFDHSSVVIEDPKTGEILAISSKKIINGKIIDNIDSILTSPITPGSVVKGASMLVGYKNNAIKIGEHLIDECIKIAGTKEKCSYITLGDIDDITALAKSSNVYQFKTAIRINGQEYYKNMKLNFNQKSFDLYRDMYHQFGLGVKTGIDLPIESTGYSSKDTRAGNLLDFVMGQYETYTPLQLSQYIQTIANDGIRINPHLLKEIHETTPNNNIGKLKIKNNGKILNIVDVDKKYMNRVQEGFYAVVNNNGGYGVGYINKNFKGAGKTGTSQSFIDTNNDGIIDTETITSSFVGYMPYKNPKISLVVTSPNSSRPNLVNNFNSIVTYRITRRITDKYNYLYGI